MREQTVSGIPKPALIAAIALSAVLALVVAGLGAYSRYTEHQRQQAVERAEQARRSGPLAMPPVPAPAAGGPECARVVEALPESLEIGGQQVPRRAIAQPAPDGAVAWGDADHDPITLRCGVPAPAELRPTSPLVEVNGVRWLEINQAGDTTWLAVDRSVYVALTLPAGSGSAPLQDLANVLGSSLPEGEVFK
ncbi:DUF3515 domain-containing protein [Salinifilum ghardaiensis]